jgi:hypothetical protein
MQMAACQTDVMSLFICCHTERLSERTDLGFVSKIKETYFLVYSLTSLSVSARTAITEEFPDVYNAIP